MGFRTRHEDDEYERLAQYERLADLFDENAEDEELLEEELEDDGEEDEEE